MNHDLPDAHRRDGAHPGPHILQGAGHGQVLDQYLTGDFYDSLASRGSDDRDIQPRCDTTRRGNVPERVSPSVL
jgi:hypothetical protein